MRNNTFQIIKFELIPSKMYFFTIRAIIIVQWRLIIISLILNTFIMLSKASIKDATIWGYLTKISQKI